MLTRSIAVAAVTALVLAACGGGDDDASPATDDVASVTEAPADGEEPKPDPTTTVAPADTEPPDTDPPATEPPATDAPAVVDQPLCADSRGLYTDTTFIETSCDEPHNAEFAGNVPLTAGRLAEDQQEIDSELTSLCLEPVEALAGEPLEGLGLEVAYDTPLGPGDDLEGEVGCWLRSPAIGSLTGSLQDIDVATALGDYVTLSAVDFGECFLPAPENTGSIGVGTIEDCSTVGVDQILSSVVLDDGPFPGADEIFDIGFEECPPFDEYEDITPMGDTPDVIAPFETEWEALGARTLLCTSYRAADFETLDDTATSAGATGDPQCFLADPPGDSVSYDDEVPCSEPHDSEFAGFVDSPVDVLPADFDEAALIIRRACGPVVEEFAGREVVRPGIAVGFSVSSDLGEPVTEPIVCFAEGTGANLLVGSLQDVSVDEAYGEARIIADVEPGTCFLFAGDSNDAGIVVECTDPGALMYFGSFEADVDAYPGLDPLRALRNERCAEILASSGLSVDPDSISGTITNEDVWNAFGGRLITCDGTPT